MKEVRIDWITDSIICRTPKLLYLSICVGLVLVIAFVYLFFLRGEWFYLLQAIVFLLMALESFLNLKRRTLNELFGKTYLHLTDEGCFFKPNLFRKEEAVLWNEVKEIRLASLKICLSNCDGEELVIDMGCFSYRNIQRIKEFVRDKSRDLEIDLNRL